MSLLVPRRSGGGGRRRPVAAAVVLVALVATSLVGAGSASAAPARLAATGGCRAVGSGDAPSGGGPDRATVVVDTGTRPVWSACVSFSGTISGIEALERAEAVITDLDPVYDQYSGLGKAVCKLRGIGSPPPDCLGKSVSSWWVSLNGKVTSVGAGGLQISDGDVEGWRYASGGAAPRPASEGTEAAAAAPGVPTTTKPPTPSTQPPSGTTTPNGGGSMSGSTEPDGTPADPTDQHPGQTTTTVKGQTTTTVKGQTTTTSADDDPTKVEGAGTEDGSGGGGESAAGAAAPDAGASPTTTDDGDGSSAPAAIGFLVVIAALGGGALIVRRRRAVGATPPA